jgi:xylulokinase
VISEAIPCRPTDLLVLPHFAGSFSPHRDPMSRCAILGLTLHTSRSQLLRALVEGTALEARLILEALDESGIAVGPLQAVGGGAKSLPWLQIKADVLGRAIHIPREPEAGCLAGAVLAATATGAYPSVLEAARAMIRVKETLGPTAANVGFYDDRFTLYKRLCPAVSDIHRALGAMGT